MMDTVIHFIKHVTGMCGEPHPSLIWGGLFGYYSYCIYIIRHTFNKRRTK